jgi:propionyl-CoA carboxylase alpha chain
MLKKILIANRGEIALRIIRTCREMGISTVAVHSDIDAASPFVLNAGEAWPLPGKTSRETYLDQDKILHIARHSGCDGIHPGYGFLSENAGFARKVTEAGLVFIGPPAEAIEVMGSKTAARKLMIAHGVPTVPGTEDAITDSQTALQAAREIGFPVLLKAAAGGGGKGMRLVIREDDFQESLESAAREAGSAFGNDAVYIEKYIEEPRHIEFQILADQHGHTIHLGERECSIQRRHQKIIEEAPSAVLTPYLRRKMGDAAVKAARACNYVNAGTIEFLVDKHLNYFFLEMNTRLQVEHPVTEWVTGLDLVREQILIASGQPMSKTNSVESFIGHAVECRLYAEDSNQNFAPSPGTIHFLKPADGPGIREDSGVEQGSEISLYYDPMISKLTAWATDRGSAIDRMIRALREYEIAGIQTSIPFLIRVLDHQAFRQGRLTTNFINQYSADLFKASPDLDKIAALAAVLFQIEQDNRTVIGGNNGRQSAISEWKMSGRKESLRKL